MGGRVATVERDTPRVGRARAWGRKRAITEESRGSDDGGETGTVARESERVRARGARRTGDGSPNERDGEKRPCVVYYYYYTVYDDDDDPPRRRSNYRRRTVSNGVLGRDAQSNSRSSSGCRRRVLVKYYYY